MSYYESVIQGISYAEKMRRFANSLRSCADGSLIYNGCVSVPILATKLFVPPVRAGLVSRPRLIERLCKSFSLDQGAGCKLTLISAPAGSGKTALVSEGLAHCERRASGFDVSWLSLDEGDSEPLRFLSYVVAALQTAVPHVGNAALAAAENTRRPLSEPILTRLINDVATIERRIVLVLDDYHLIDAPQIDEALTMLLAHQPPQLHLVIITREDPLLPLSRLRVRGQLSEIRIADLRFTISETARLLNGVMGLDLSDKDISTLDARTDGWIAGLQMAALSLQGRDNATEFINSFAGDHRYITDYLIEEVLQRQPQSVRAFLLRTSILERLSGPLCDALCRTHENGPGPSSQGHEEESSAAQLLQNLERDNLFVIPLDDRRQWYRYHHLFGDVLYTHLLHEHADLVPLLHQTASEWYQDNGMPGDAIRHALAAGEVERAAELVESAWARMDRNRQVATWLGWAVALPEAPIRVRPVLCAGYAWALLDAGELEAGEVWLRSAERWLEAGPGTGITAQAIPDGPLVADEEEYRFLPATVFSARAYIALAHGELAQAERYARRALELLPESEQLRRGIPASLLGLATWTAGQLDAAFASFAEAMSSFRRAGNLLFATTGTFILADIRVAQGRLLEAIDVYERSLELASTEGEPASRAIGDLYSGLSELACERGDLSRATEYLDLSESFGRPARLPRWEYRWRLAQARIRQALGDLDGALDSLSKAQQVYVRGPVPDLRTTGAMQARLRVAQGSLAEARDWVQIQGLSFDDGDLSFRREYDYLTLARVLIARYQLDGDQETVRQALSLLQRLLGAAEDGRRTGSMIEILALKALAHEAQGDNDAALSLLERALTRAATQGYVRTFIDEGAPMERLLSLANAHQILPDYTGRLLAIIRAEKARRGPGAPTGPWPSSQPLIEPLSPRELEVLHLLAQGLSNREIGQRLFVALSTVKGHNRRIYGKLQVRRRTEAVARARELDLL